MVWSAGTELERPPMSVILPRLYLGAESDVTHDCLSSLDISYVLSVSRCCPQPSFLPSSRYLRIPIDDSLSDDLLLWLPQALRFIDSARASGASVLVHCAAGISRSPALTVAYIMYTLDLDLDHAYRFVKERRPSISPNLNFLGQLQHFQGTLTQKTSLTMTPEQRPDLGLDRTSQDIPLSGDVPSHHRSEGAYPPGPTLRDTSSSGNCRLQKTLSLNLQSVKAIPPPVASLREKRQSLTLSLTPVSPGHLSSGNPAPERGQEAQTGSLTDHAMCPLSLTLNRLLSWGERLLLAAPVRMGQPALPYSC